MAKVVVSYPAWQGAKVIPATFEVPVLDPKPVAGTAKKSAANLAEVQKTLDRHVMIEFAQQPLKEVLSYLSEITDIAIEIDEQSFRKQGINDLGAATINATNANGRFSDVLQKVLDQVKATYRVEQASRTLVVVPG